MKMLSVWESSSFHRRPHLAVIGGGIVGLFTAIFYKRMHPQHHVVVLEKGAYPSGASIKNAGFACFGSPTELLADIRTEGTDAALQRVEMRWKGLHELRQELGDQEMGYEPVGGHEIFMQDDPLYTMVQERFDELNTLLRPLLGANVFHWDNDRVGEFGLEGVTHMVRIDKEGALNSGKLMSTLWRKSISEGVLFRSNAAVTRLSQENGQVEMVLDNGDRIVADRVVVATNGYTRDLLPELDVVPARGQVVLTGPIPGLRLKGTFHYGEGFYYFRELKGGVLLGGGRDLDITGETTTEAGTSPIIQKALEKLLRENILPGREFEITQRWSGVMAFGVKSKSPLVVRYTDRIVTAVRLGGMGVAIGIHVARMAAGLLDE